MLEFATLDNAAQGPLAAAVLERAYAKLGIGFKLRVLPLRRGIQMADSGDLDGDLMHTGISLTEWKHLVWVKVPVARVSFMAYQIGPDCPDRVSTEELATGRTAYMRGTRGIELILPESARLASANNWDALRAMREGMTRYAVTGQLESDALLAVHEASEVCKIREPVLALDLFHSLHERHAALAARVEQVMTEMQARGEIAKIWAEQGKLARERLLLKLQQSAR